MNDPFIAENAAHFAKRVVREGADETQRIARAYALAFQREPTTAEMKMCEAHIEAARTKIHAANHGAECLAATSGDWQSLTRALLRTNEFLYVD
jgi:hypothetical protein